MKTSKKLLVVVLALVMILACTMPAMALNDTSATFQQVKLANAPTVTGEFTVTLSIFGDIVDNDGPINRYNYTVNMGQTGITKVYYVSDVLEAAQSQFSWLFFNYDHHGFDPQPLNYVSAVCDSNLSSTDFAPITEFSGNLYNLNLRNGWMFRVNNKYMILHSDNAPAGWNESTMGKPGASIKQAYIQAGDHIDLYFANTISNLYATKTVILEQNSISSTSITLKGYRSSSYYNSNNKWIINNFSAIPSTSGTFTFKIDGVPTTQSFAVGGYVTFDISGLSTGSHTIEMLPTYTQYTYTDEDNNQHTCEFLDFMGAHFTFTL